MFIEGGLAGPGSSSTGDTDCTTSHGSDCGDVYTDGVFDTDPTGSGDDGCRVSTGLVEAIVIKKSF